MKTILKQILGFLLTLLAGAAGFNENAEMFVSFGSVVAGTFALTQLVKTFLPGMGQVLSWFTGIVLSMAAWWLDLGIFADFSWYFAAITGVPLALIANGVYDAGWLQRAWELLREAFNRTPPAITE